MSVVSVREHHRGRGGSDSDDLSSDSRRVFTVYTDQATDDEHVIRASGMVPRIGDLHHVDTNKRCSSVSYDQDDAHFLRWNVVCEYTTAQLTGGGLGPGGSQEFGLPKRSWEAVEVKRRVEYDINRKPLVYTNDRPFQLEVSDSIIKLKIVRDELNFSGDAARQYHNKINADPISGAQPETVRLRIAAQENTEGGTFTFWTVTYELEFWEIVAPGSGAELLTGGWNPWILEADYYHWEYYDSSTSTWINYTGHPESAPPDVDHALNRIVRIVDGNGQDVSTPEPLDTYGRRIAPQYVDEYCIFTQWEIYQTATFGDLNLPL